MRLWLDDERTPPEGYDLWAVSALAAIAALSTRNITHISFDHDLGEEKTGYDVAKFLEREAAHGTISRLTWDIHSANLAGSKYISLAMQSADNYWKQRERTRPDEWQVRYYSATGGGIGGNIGGWVAVPEIPVDPQPLTPENVVTAEEIAGGVVAAVEAGADENVGDELFDGDEDEDDEDYDVEDVDEEGDEEDDENV